MTVLHVVIFIKSIGNVVGIKDGKIETIWDITVDDATYQTVANAMAEYVKTKAVQDFYFSREGSTERLLKIKF